MFKNIKPLKISDNLDTKYRRMSHLDMIHFIKLIPLGVDEIISISGIAPIFIAGGDDLEFVMFSGLSPNHTIFHNNNNIAIPKILNTYPFFMIKVINENNKNSVVIAIDKNDKYVNKSEKISIFNKDKDLTNETQDLIDDVKVLYKQRILSKAIVKELQKKDLLIKQSFNVKVNDEIKPVISDYYIVDKNRLNKLDDETLALWSRRGWMGIIDAHIYSLRNFKKLVDLVSQDDK